MKKPDAITVIPKETFREQIWNLPASDMLGVGRATEKKLSSVGIHTIGQIAQFPCEFFQRRLGKCGVDLWRFANGLDTSQVTVRDYEAPDKTVGHGMTALQDLENDAEVWKFILELCQDIGHKHIIWVYYMSYWNNRRICHSIGSLPPAVKRERYLDAANVAVG